MRVKLLYVDGCAHHEPLLSHLRWILGRGRIEADVELVPVGDAEEAEELGSLGSPTVRVDGRDVEAAAVHRHDVGLKCRIYQTPQGLKGAPPGEWILTTIRNSPRA